MSRLKQDSVQIVRRFKAPPAQVWLAWTDPAWVRRWFGSDPNGIVAAAALDVRPGGRFEVTFRGSDEIEHTCSGVYIEVQATARLAFSWRWKSEPGIESFVTVLLAPDGAGAVMRFEHAQLEGTSTHDYAQGWASTFAKLERALDGR